MGIESVFLLKFKLGTSLKFSMRKGSFLSFDQATFSLIFNR